MAVGYSFANHKTLLSVVFFFAFQFDMQILGTMGLFGIDDLNLSWELNGVTALHVGMSIAIVAVALYGAVFYVIHHADAEKAPEPGVKEKQEGRRGSAGPLFIYALIRPAAHPPRRR